ncbi:hypothetical protein QQX98_002638 [Neonectria punicea]|uniref:Uncharacterized protein n=1 Tax=Neonectria punicea TaxID=979145 RepID=A0ABR1HHI1_9HYPO
MAHNPFNTYNPFAGANHPPPLFAELEAPSVAPLPTGAHQASDGGTVFEMPAEAVAPRKDVPRPATQQSPPEAADTGTNANPWPFYLEPGSGSPPAQDAADGKNESKTEAPTGKPAQPWPYHGPGAQGQHAAAEHQPVKESSGTYHSEGQGPMGQRYQEQNYARPQIPHGTRPPASAPSSPDPGNQHFLPYPAPLNLAHRPAKPASPPAFKPYAPPGAHDPPAPGVGVGRTQSQSTTHSTNSISYQPYRPHSPAGAAASGIVATGGSSSSSPATAAAAASQPYSTGTTTNPFYSPPPANSSAYPPPAKANVASRPPTAPPTAAPTATAGSVSNATLGSGPPSVTPTPTTAPTSPAPPVQSTVSPLTTPFQQPVQPHSGHTQPSPSSVTLPPASTPLSHPATPASTTAVPFAQPQYASTVPTQQYAPAKASTPATSTSMPGSAAGTPAYHSVQPVYPQAGNPDYNIPHPTYAPAASPPAQMTSPLPHHHTGPAALQQQSQVRPMTTEPQSASSSLPQSPPPPYSQTVPQRPGSQPPAAGNPSPYQLPSQGQGLPGQANLSAKAKFLTKGNLSKVSLLNKAKHLNKARFLTKDSLLPRINLLFKVKLPTKANLHTKVSLCTKGNLSKGSLLSRTNLFTKDNPLNKAITFLKVKLLRQAIIFLQPSYAPMSPSGQSIDQNPYNYTGPPLPPRPMHPNEQAHGTYGPAPGSFGSPAGYNPANYPPPPKTYYNPPPPALPARPSTGKLFTSANAKKWFDKTNQVLESKLAPMLQGPIDSRYRPGQNQQQTPQQNQHNQHNQPNQQAQQNQPHQYNQQAFHAPHLAPQFQGTPGTGPQPGMSGPQPGMPGPNQGHSGSQWW